MKHKISIIALMLAVATICGCTDKLFEDNATYTFKEGDVVECLLKVDVGDFRVMGSDVSRAAADTIATEAERRISDFWVFQYDDTDDHNILVAPRYYKSSSLDNDTLKAVLSASRSTIYVVTNTNDSTWASNTEDFATLNKLKQQSLTNIEPIIVGESEGQTKADSVSIPMCGGIEVTDISKFSKEIIVPVTRMFAKLTIKAKMLNDMNITDIEVNNIPNATWIESRSCDDDTSDDEKRAAECPSSTSFITRSYNTVNDKTQANQTNAKFKDTTKDYIIYVPENIQGDNGNTSTTTMKSETTNYLTDMSAPAMAVKFHLRIKDGTETVVTSATVYPGSNTYSNFNVKRNRVYNIISNFNSKEYFFPTPSSNCFVVEPGDTLTFWPYYRTEEGGGYDIKTYLYPDGSNTEINKVSIIWQDKDVIGNNTNGDKVKLSLPKDASNLSAEELVKKIRISVATKSEGNALIGAYNSNGDIIWSWHIWVTDNHPDNVGNAIRYTTYRWDSSKIYTDEARIPGYQVMPCNLGAKEFEPNSDDPTVTYGPLYQWGRKDPFPQMKYKTKRSGMYNYNYSESNVQVYNNANGPIKMGEEKATAERTSSTSLLFKTVKCTATSSASDEDTQRADGLKYSINHPTIFISAASLELTTGNYNNQGSYINNGDWLLGHDDKLWGGLKPNLSQNHRQVVNAHGKKAESDIVSYMWNNYGSEKTIFDPCPSGWRVPPSDLWMGLTIDGESVHLDNVDNKSTFIEYINSNEDIDNDIAPNNGFHMYLDGWKTGNTTFFPTPGLRLADGQPFHLGMCGNYHNATSAPMVKTTDGVESIVENGRVNCLHFHAEKSWTQVNVFENQRLFVYKAIAGPIRCVRDKK